MDDLDSYIEEKKKNPEFAKEYAKQEAINKKLLEEQRKKINRRTIRCDNCKFWDKPEDFEESLWNYLGKCKNENFILASVYDVTSSLHEISGVSVKYEDILEDDEDMKDYLYFETGAAFGCIHFQEVEGLKPDEALVVNKVCVNEGGSINAEETAKHSHFIKGIDSE